MSTWFSVRARSEERLETLLSMAKQALVCLGENRRVVTVLSLLPPGLFTERDAFLKEVREQFAVILQLGPKDTITLQQKSERWQGMFVDYMDNSIEDGAVYTLVVTRAEVHNLTVLFREQLA